MQAIVFQHTDSEGLGAIAEWLAARHATVRIVRPDHGETLPAPLAADLAIVMGGTMSVNDADQLPWLAAEREWLAVRAAADAPLLGICLGAQLIATALGARVYRAAHKEIGWFDVHACASPTADGFHFPECLRVFHWHGDTFELPSGARRLASSSACREQGFQFGRNVIGLQCHPEMTMDIVQAWAAHGTDEIAAGGKWVQNAATMAAATQADYDALHAVLTRLLDYLARERGAAPG